MKRVTRYDENFYTLPKHVPDVNIAVERCVTLGISDIFENIADKLQLEDPLRFASEAVFDLVDSDLSSIKSQLIECITEYINNYNIEE